MAPCNVVVGAIHKLVEIADCCREIAEYLGSGLRPTLSRRCRRDSSQTLRFIVRRFAANAAMPKIGYSRHNNGAVRNACAPICSSEMTTLDGSRPLYFNGAARSKQGRKCIESRLFAMLRMLLALGLRGIIPGLEMQHEFKNKKPWRT